MGEKMGDFPRRASVEIARSSAPALEFSASGTPSRRAGVPSEEEAAALAAARIPGRPRRRGRHLLGTGLELPPTPSNLERAAQGLPLRGRPRCRRGQRLPGSSSAPSHRAVSEHVEQAQLVARCRHLRQGLLVFAIPNGGLRDKRTAARLRAEGVLAGVPDLLVAESRMGYHGMFIEMKAENQRRPSSVRPIQRRVHEMLRRRGYRVEVCYGVDDAWRKVLFYLDCDYTLLR